MPRPLQCLCAAALLSAAQACTSYQALGDPVADLAAYPSPVGPARVTLRSGERITFVSVQVTGDSLKGVLKGGESRTIALTYVEMVELRVYDSEKSDLWTNVAVCAVISTLGGESDCASEDAEE